MSSIEYKLYDEIIIVGEVYDEYDIQECAPSDICICKTVWDAKHYLKSYSNNIIDVYGDLNDEIERLRALHGILTPATIISNEFETAYIVSEISERNSNDYTGTINGPYSDQEELMETLENILKYIEPDELEGYCVLYGYELSLTLDIDEESMDEEQLLKCQKVLENIGLPGLRKKQQRI